MDLKEYRELIQLRFHYLRGGYLFKYEENPDFEVANEIVAYLITKNFNYSNEIKFGYSNLSDFYITKMKKINSRKNKIYDLSEIKKYDSIDKETQAYINDFRKLQRREAKIRKVCTNHQTYLKNNGFEVLPVSYMKTKQKGRIYDLANLEFLFQRRKLEKSVDLFDLTISNMISSSKSVSDNILIEAYDALNREYAKAKETDDKMEYIFKWINFFRMETAMRFSLIYKIADFGTKSKTINQWTLSHLSDIWGTRYFDDGYIAKPFQILRHEKFIESYFSAKTEEELLFIIEQAEKERILETILVRFMEDESKEVLKDFSSGKEEMIEEVYNFCRYEYPIIENYIPTNFYIDGDCEKIDKRKIKIIRKIFKYLLHPAELKKIL